MTVGTAKQLTAVLDSWVAQGIHEDPPHSNRTSIGEEYGFNGVAWCCETMSVAQTRIGIHCFHEAAVVRAVALAQAGVNSLKWLPKGAVIAEGDMPCFQWADGSHHISYVRDPGTQTKFQTDAGNEHDAMFTQWRDRKYVMGFIRLPYAPANTDPALPPSDPGEDDMARLAIYYCNDHGTAKDGPFFASDGASFIYNVTHDNAIHGKNLGQFGEPQDAPHAFLENILNNQHGDVNVPGNV